MARDMSGSSVKLATEQIATSTAESGSTVPADIKSSSHCANTLDPDVKSAAGLSGHGSGTNDSVSNDSPINSASQSAFFDMANVADHSNVSLIKDEEVVPDNRSRSSSGLLTPMLDILRPNYEEYQHWYDLPSRVLGTEGVTPDLMVM